jgi:hypothetical protein
MDDVGAALVLIFFGTLFACTMCSVNMNHSRESLVTSLDYGSKVCQPHGGLQDLDVWPNLTGNVQVTCKDGSSIKGSPHDEKQP